MFQVNDDLSIYVTRGDVVYLKVSADNGGKPYTFEAGEVLRLKIYGKKNAENVVLQKDFPVVHTTQGVEIILTEADTKIGSVVNKPVDYWYEVELNPYDNPQTIIGYDEDGAKLFRLFPEGADVPEYEPPKPEDIPIVDEELDMTSPRPVQNQAIARAFANLKEGYEATHDAVAALHVTPQMFGAIGDGVADDTEAINKALSYAAEKNLSVRFPKVANGYFISNGITINADTVMLSPIIYNGNGVAITIGNKSVQTSNKHISLMVKSGKSEFVAGSVGVEVVNVNNSNINIDSVKGFNYGVRFIGDAMGCAYNNVNITTIGNCEYALTLLSKNGGWVNDNHFHGGRFYCNTDVSFVDSSVGVLIDSECEYFSNNNRFYNQCLEGLHTAIVLNYANYNYFYDIRTENCTYALEENNESQYNIVKIGYGITAKKGDGASYIAEPRNMVDYFKKLYDGRLIAKNTVHNEMVAYNPDLCEISNGTIHRRLYRILREGDHIVIPSGRGAGIIVDTANCKSFIIVPHYVNGMTGRSIVRMFDSEGNILNVAPVGVSNRPWTYSSINETDSFITGSNNNASAYIKVPDECAKLFIGLYGHTTHSHVHSFDVYSENARAFVYNYGALGLPSIPTSVGEVGDFCPCETPQASNIRGWLYTENNEWVALPL